MPTIQVDTEQLLHAALQLPRPELEQFVTQLQSLRLQHNTARLTQDEAELLLKINEGLLSTTQQRLDELIAKRQAQSLTAAEHQELIELTEQSEKIDANRLQHLLALAALRKVSLDEVVQQLGLQSIPHD
jgi:acetolactate synthase small subunit